MTTRRLRIYLAAPLFSDAERAYNEGFCADLERVADVFLPQRDGLLFHDLVESGVAIQDARRMIFDVDLGAIRQCDIVLAVLDGRAVDEGVAFEMGVAHSLAKHCIGLKTDHRSLLPSGDNPMIVMACDAYCVSKNEVLKAIERFSRSKGTLTHADATRTINVRRD
jgi:nucleoside 2-deoxyribosyltransferase